MARAVGAFAKTFASPEKGAKDIDNLNRRFYSGVHERQLVDESTIRAYRLDLNYYRQATESLQELGFRELGAFARKVGRAKRSRGDSWPKKPRRREDAKENAKKTLV